MKKLKLIKMLALVLSVLSLAIAFGACGGDGNGGSKPSIATPMIILHEDMQESKVYILWTSVENAKEYNLTITDSSGIAVTFIFDDNQKDEEGIIDFTFSGQSGNYTLSIVAVAADSQTHKNSFAASMPFEITQAQTIQLEIPNVAYDYSTNTLSWNKVENAIGYGLTVNEVDVADDLISENENKMQYIVSLDENGSFDIQLTAFGKTDHKITYLDSDTYTDNFLFQAPPAPDAEKLYYAPLSYRVVEKQLFFYKKTNASGYYIKINNKEIPFGDFVYDQYQQRYFFDMSDYPAGTYTAYVVVLGDGINYSNSDQQKLTFTIKST